MITEPVKTFSRVFWGYDRASVDAHVEMLTAQQQLLRDDVESLMARVKAHSDEAAALREEVALLTDTSPAPRAVQQRMAKMLRRAVDEVAEMEAEARAEAAALISAAEAEAEAEQRKSKEVLADLAQQREAFEADYAETKQRLDAELARMRSDTQAAIDEAWHHAQQDREQLLKHTRGEVDEASQRRIRILEQLMGVYRDLENIPATLNAAYEDRDDASEAATSSTANTVVPLDERARTG